MEAMAKRLQSNDLNRRITLQRKGSGEDDAGYPSDPDEWIDIDTIWASREPLRGREFFAAAADQAEKTVIYKIWYRDEIHPDMRFKDNRDDRIYNIYAVLDDVFDDRTETHLMTTEELQNG